MNKKYSLKRLLPWLLIIIWMIVIFKLSAEEGNISGGRSNQIAKTIQQKIKLLPDALKSGNQGAKTIELIIRKAGHVLEYCILSILFLTGLIKVFKNKRLAYILAFLLPLIYAALDEYHQTLIPWRDGRISDVFIDGAGVILGILIYTLVDYIIKIKNNKQAI